MGLARKSGVLFHALRVQQVLAIQLSLPTALDQDSYGNTHTHTHYTHYTHTKSIRHLVQ